MSLDIGLATYDQRTEVPNVVPAGLGTNSTICTALLTSIAVFAVAVHAQAFDFKKQLFGLPSTLGLNVVSVDLTTGHVNVNGGDSRAPTTPFTWDWGDGTTPQPGFFPLSHTYSDKTRNYVLTVTAHYPSDVTDSTQTAVRFGAPAITPVALQSETAVTVASSTVALDSRMPGYLAPQLNHFNESDFGVVPRTTIEYVLSAAASIQRDFANNNVVQLDGGFPQYVLRDPNLVGGSMYSLWFTAPVALGAAGGAMNGSIQFSSFMHEMGHNVSLNSPAHYYYGGKIDGNANAIFSESMGQIFQHATAFELINHADTYGLSADLVLEIQTSAESAMNVVRNSFEQYVAEGSPFRSWNNPTTSSDETIGTFMTVAYKFAEHAETSAQGYRTPIKRMMELLQLFNADWRTRYDQHNDSTQADAFRSTLLVAAMSYAFSLDLRQEFRDLRFPIDDPTFDELLAMVSLVQPGDYDRDGDVDGGDLLEWQRAFGSTGTGLRADGNGNGEVDAADYVIWRDSFGAGSAATRVQVTVPEPSFTMLLALAGLVANSDSLRRRRLR